MTLAPVPIISGTMLYRLAHSFGSSWASGMQLKNMFQKSDLTSVDLGYAYQWKVSVVHVQHYLRGVVQTEAFDALGDIARKRLVAIEQQSLMARPNTTSFNELLAHYRA